MPQVSPDIFKAYDIRGIPGRDIDGDIAELIGRAFARVLSDLAGKPIGELRVALSRDMRLSAPELAARYRDGLVREGVHVFDAGMVGTEMLLAQIKARYADARIEHLDGVSVDYDDWHFNVRPSNTEPLLRLCLESLVSQEDMERRRDEVLALIRDGAA
jgi:phosphomannomutase